MINIQNHDQMEKNWVLSNSTNKICITVDIRSLRPQKKRKKFKKASPFKEIPNASNLQDNKKLFGTKGEGARQEREVAER
jgi:hypothetical protein